MPGTITTSCCRIQARVRKGSSSFPTTLSSDRHGRPTPSGLGSYQCSGVAGDAYLALTCSGPRKARQAARRVPGGQEGEHGLERAVVAEVPGTQDAEEPHSWPASPPPPPGPDDAGRRHEALLPHLATAALSAATVEWVEARASRFMATSTGLCVARPASHRRQMVVALRIRSAADSGARRIVATKPQRYSASSRTVEWSARRGSRLAHRRGLSGCGRRGRGGRGGSRAAPALDGTDRAARAPSTNVRPGVVEAVARRYSPKDLGTDHAVLVVTAAPINKLRKRSGACGESVAIV